MIIKTYVSNMMFFPDKFSKSEYVNDQSGYYKIFAIIIKKYWVEMSVFKKHMFSTVKRFKLKVFHQENFECFF